MSSKRKKKGVIYDDRPQPVGKKAKQFSCQCRMISYDGNAGDDCVSWLIPLDGARAHFEYVAWIPKKKAIVGKWLRIDGMQGNWRVEEIWSTKQTAEATIRSRDHLSQRDASDV